MDDIAAGVADGAAEPPAAASLEHDNDAECAVAVARLAAGVRRTPDGATTRVLEQLQAELHASQLACKKLQMEGKIHKEAWEAEADKFAGLSSKFDTLKAEHAAAQARITHMVGLVQRVHDCVLDQMTGNASFGTEVWLSLYQQLLAAVRPLFAHRA